MTEEFSLDDLVRLSGVNLRTIRFYIQEGVLPGPDSRGKFAHYSKRHLDRLSLVQRFKQFNMPLQQIKQILDNASENEISQLLMFQNIMGAAPAQPPAAAAPSDGSSALDYIQDLERMWSPVKAEVSAPAPMPTPVAKKSILRSASVAEPEVLPTASETWQRRVIRDGVEILIRSDIQIDDDTLLAVSRLLQKDN
jgi:DNA-binding transcriptional MerR regulator